MIARLKQLTERPPFVATPGVGSAATTASGEDGYDRAGATTPQGHPSGATDLYPPGVTREDDDANKPQKPPSPSSSSSSSGIRQNVQRPAVKATDGLLVDMLLKSLVQNERTAAHGDSETTVADAAAPEDRNLRPASSLTSTMDHDAVDGDGRLLGSGSRPAAAPAARSDDGVYDTSSLDYFIRMDEILESIQVGFVQ